MATARGSMVEKKEVILSALDEPGLSVGHPCGLTTTRELINQYLQKKENKVVDKVEDWIEHPCVHIEKWKTISGRNSLIDSIEIDPETKEVICLLCETRIGCLHHLSSTKYQKKMNLAGSNLIDHMSVYVGPIKRCKYCHEMLPIIIDDRNYNILFAGIESMNTEINNNLYSQVNKKTSMLFMLEFGMSGEEISLNAQYKLLVSFIAAAVKDSVMAPSMFTGSIIAVLYHFFIVYGHDYKELQRLDFPEDPDGFVSYFCNILSNKGKVLLDKERIEEITQEFYKSHEILKRDDTNGDLYKTSVSKFVSNLKYKDKQMDIIPWKPVKYVGEAPAHFKWTSFAKVVGKPILEQKLDITKNWVGNDLHIHSFVNGKCTTCFIEKSKAKFYCSLADLGKAKVFQLSNEIYCPNGDLHTFEGKECKQCGNEKYISLEEAYNFINNRSDIMSMSIEEVITETDQEKGEDEPLSHKDIFGEKYETKHFMPFVRKIKNGELIDISKMSDYSICQLLFNTLMILLESMGIDRFQNQERNVIYSIKKYATVHLTNLGSETISGIKDVYMNFIGWIEHTLRSKKDIIQVMNQLSSGSLFEIERYMDSRASSQNVIQTAMNLKGNDVEPESNDKIYIDGQEYIQDENTDLIEAEVGIEEEGPELTVETLSESGSEEDDFSDEEA